MVDKTLDYFSLFALPKMFSLDLSKLKTSFIKLQQKIHPDNFVSATSHEQRLAMEYAARVNDAYRTLNDPLKRATYLLKLHGIALASETDTHMPVDFLMEQMEWREALSEAQATHDENKIAAVKHEIEQAWQKGEQLLASYLDVEPIAALEAREMIRKMQFYYSLTQQLLTNKGGE